MSLETDLFDALKGLVANRVYPDVGPQGGALPYITYQQVGGQPINYMAGVPDVRNARVQVNVWAKTRAEAMSLIRQAEDLIRLAPALQATTVGGAVSVYEDDTRLYGAMQDYSCWFTD